MAARSRSSKAVDVIDLSPDQEAAIDMIQQWFRSGGEEFRLGGLAGTGKTTIITHLPGLLRLPYGSGVEFVAPTGKAASVLARKLPTQFAATTVHRFMYQPLPVHCDACEGDEACHGNNSNRCRALTEDGNGVCRLSFRWNPPDPPPKLVICDEASMVGNAMYGHLQEVGSQLLFVGDHGQLAPIDGGVTLMNESNLDVKLERIHRQVANSPILRLAMMARAGKPIVPRRYGPGVECLLGSSIREGFDADENTLLLCYTNAMRKKMNALMRRGLGHKSDHPEPGDRVVCLRNNFTAGVANGQIGEVVSCRVLGQFYRLTVRMVDTDVEYNGVCLIDQFNEIGPQRFMRGVDMWTYGYCLTTHKAQGSEADRVIIIQEDKMRFMRKSERQRWMYTAITRAKKSLTIYTPIYGGASE